MTAFDDIIQSQLSVKDHYIKHIFPPNGGFTIVLKDNKIQNVINGKGWINPPRKENHISFVENVLKKHKIVDCNINISLADHPISGVLNFCRRKGNYKEFLIPSHRFTNDDILLDDQNNTFANFDLQKTYIKEKLMKTQDKQAKIYTSCIPHHSKIPYFKYALSNPDICDGYAYTGTVHKLVHLSKDLYSKLKQGGIAGEEKQNWTKHLQYKYVLYNDGNTLSDRMRLLLCTNSVIIRQTSPYEELYTYLLKQRENYIEYRNVEELRTIYDDLEADPYLYNTIVSNNNTFIDTILTYDHLMEYFATLLNGLHS